MVDNSPRILVVDDEPDIVAFLSQALTDEGYDVRTAADGLDALDVMRRWSPDVVLTDLVLPKLHGWDLTIACRSFVGRRPHVVAMTAAGPRALRTARQAGAEEALAKPINLSEVLDVLNTVLHERAA